MLRRVPGVLVSLHGAPGTKSAARIVDRFRFLSTDWKSGTDSQSQAKTCEQARPVRAGTFQHSTDIKTKGQALAGKGELCICLGTSSGAREKELRPILPRPGCA